MMVSMNHSAFDGWKGEIMYHTDVKPMTALVHYLSKLWSKSSSSLYAQSLMSLPYTGGGYQVINEYSRW